MYGQRVSSAAHHAHSQHRTDGRDVEAALRLMAYAKSVGPNELLVILYELGLHQVPAILWYGAKRMYFKGDATL